MNDLTSRVSGTDYTTARAMLRSVVTIPKKTNILPTEDIKGTSQHASAVFDTFVQKLSVSSRATTTNSDIVLLTGALDLSLDPTQDKKLATRALLLHAARASNVSADKQTNGEKPHEINAAINGIIWATGSGVTMWQGLRIGMIAVAKAWAETGRFVHIGTSSSIRTAAVEDDGVVRATSRAERPSVDTLATEFGIRGAGVRVLLADSGLSTGHCRYQTDREANEVVHDTYDLSGSQSNICDRYTTPQPRGRIRYTQYSCSSSSCASSRTDHVDQQFGHGTHCAGLVRTAAAEANISMIDVHDSTKLDGSSLNIPNNVYSHLLGNAHVCHGARVLSFSWAADFESEYSWLDREFDWFVYNHPETVIVVAAGNSGANGRYSLGSPATAKNVISVGALVATDTFFRQAYGAPSNPRFSWYWKSASPPFFEHPDTTMQKEPTNTFYTRSTEHCRPVMPFSSRGPTADHRAKPDMAAIGSFSVSDHSTGLANGESGSCAPESVHNSMQGTSMATPTVAGVAARASQLLQIISFVTNNEGCAQDIPCVWSYDMFSAIANDTAQDIVAHTNPKVDASLVRALLASATTSCQALSQYSVYYDTSQYKAVRRPYFVEGGTAGTRAAEATGMGELLLGQNIPTETSQFVFRGESESRYFELTALANSKTVLGARLASQSWSGAQHTLCFRALVDKPIVSAVLAWNDYPSTPSCSTCLITDLSVMILESAGQFGGTANDIQNNLERLKVKLKVSTGEFFKVSVRGADVSSLSGKQRYSLAVHADAELITDKSVSPHCKECAFETESVPCIDGNGVGERTCVGSPEGHDECDMYVSCFGLAPDGNTTIVGLHGQGCEPDIGCYDVMHPSASGNECILIPCNSEEHIAAAARDVRVPSVGVPDSCMAVPWTNTTRYALANRPWHYVDRGGRRVSEPSSIDAHITLAAQVVLIVAVVSVVSIVSFDMF